MRKAQKVVLCIAEKPSVAKSIAELLAQGNVRKFTGKSKYNPIFEFEYHMNREPCTLRVTSVLGHIMGLKFPDHCKSWHGTSMESLFEVNMEKEPIESSVQVVQNIKAYSKDIHALQIWTDCDREGEAIGFDIIEVARKVRPNIEVYRAHFSALTKAEIEKAATQLRRPNKALSDAVQIRQEIDLRIGATFTRFQTLLLRDTINKQGVISYGPCQFPTLGFIVERHQVIENFEKENFWYIHMKYKSEKGAENATFQWDRNKVFDKFGCLVLFEKVQEDPKAKVTKVDKQKRLMG